MFGLFKRSNGKDSAKPSLDAIRFDTTGYESEGEPDQGGVRVWFTPEGDGVALYFFGKSPDLLADAQSVADLRVFYEGVLKAAGVRLVETEVCRAGGCPAVRVVFKTPQQPSGMTYVGSLTIPFRDFSFVIKVQSEEWGTTGGREAILLARRLATGEEPSFNENRMSLPGWEPDGAEFDESFPDHPVSRVRRVLRHVAGSLLIEPAVVRLPGFLLPEPHA
ncbi:MAG: hypothetical protein ACR2FY_18175 [Pirellulaceae bacterium]